MKGLRRGAAIAAMMLSLTICAAAADDLSKQPKETLIGQFSCLTVPSVGPQVYGSLTFSGTSGLIISSADSGSQSVYADFEPGGLPVCETFAKDARAKVDSAGCMASQIKTVDPSQNDSSARRSVQFVCTGPRDRIVDTLARLAELIVMSAR